MVKKINVKCQAGSSKVPVDVYVGEPSPNSSSPIYFQSLWLAKERGVNIPKEFSDSLSKMQALSEKNRVALSELCQYIFDELNSVSRLNTEITESNKKIDLAKKKEEGKFLDDKND